MVVNLVYLANRHFIWIALLCYPLAACISTTFGLDNNFLSKSFRIATILLGFYLLISRFRSKVNRELLFYIAIFITFWVFYFSVVVVNHSYGISRLSIFHYFSWGGYALLLSMMALSFRGSLGYTEINHIKYFGLVINAFLFLHADTVVIGANGYSYDTGRIQLDVFNTIAFGNLSAIIIIACFVSYLNRPNIFSRASNIVIVFFSLFVIIQTANRASLIGLLVCTLFMLKNTKTQYKYSFTAVIAIVFGCVLYFGITGAFYDRFVGISISDMSVLYRIESYFGALNYIISNPLIGGAVEVPSIGYYPHNVILEILMSTGIIGAGLVLVLLLFVVPYLNEIAKYSPYGMFITGYFVFSFVTANISGSIVTNTALWLSISLLLSAKQKLRAE